MNVKKLQATSYPMEFVDQQHSVFQLPIGTMSLTSNQDLLSFMSQDALPQALGGQEPGRVVTHPRGLSMQATRGTTNLL